MSEFIKVTEAKESGMIPEPWHAYIPDTCEYCQNSLYINQTRTVLKCLDPGCPRKLGYQLDAFLKELGYKGYGPETLTKICSSYAYHSVLDFIVGMHYMGLIAALNERELSFPALVEILHIPNFGVKARKLFHGYSCYADFIADLAKSKDPSNFIMRRVGGYQTALEVVRILKEYDSVLRRITDYVTVTAPIRKIVPIAITGHIQNVTADGHALTKEGYIRCLNRLAKPCGLEFQMSGALMSVVYIVADYPSGSHKYRIGQSRGNLASSAQLYQAVQKLYNDGGYADGADRVAE